MARQKIPSLFLKGIIVSLIFCFPVISQAKDIDIGLPGDSINILGTNLCLSASCIDNWNDISGSWITNGTSIYYNTGNVGIGISNPAAALDVYRTEPFRTRGQVVFGGSAYIGSGDRLLMVDNVGNVIATTMSDATGLPSSSTSGQTLRSNGTSWIANSILYNNGTNVGVGTTNPSGRLHVLGDMWVSSAADDAWRFRPGLELGYQYGFTDQHGNTQAFVNEQGTTNQAFVLGDVDPGNNSTLFGISLMTGASNPTTGAEAWQPKFMVSGSGNVGIGTTNPAQNLHVSGGSQFDSVSFGVTPGEAQTLALTTVEYVNAKVGGSAGITTGTSGQTLRHNGTGWVANSLLYNNGTNVGVGTTNPAQKLHVSIGNIALTNVNSVSTSQGLIKFSAPSYPNAFAGIEGKTNAGGADQVDLIFYTGYGASSPEKMRILAQNGNVGIGTTAPGALLHLSSAGVKLKMTDTTLTLGLASEVGGQLIDYGTNFMQLGNRNASYDGGFFRIDTRAAYQSEFFSIKFVPASGLEDTIFKLSTTGNLSADGNIVVEGTTNSSIAGNLGIGKTNPAYKLDVAGTANFDGLAYGVTPGTTQTLALTTVEYVNSMISGASTSTVGYWSANGNNIFNSNSGNIGLGVTAPTQKLDVAGNIQASGYVRGVTIKGTVDTAAATAAKVATISDYTPTAGDLLAITFTLGNSVSTPTLDINGTGAKNIRLGTTNANTTIMSLGAGSTILLYYDGTYYLMMGSQRTSDSTTDANMYFSVNKVMGATLYDYKIIAEGDDGRYYPLTLEEGTGTTKTVTTRPLKIDGNIMYYNGTTNVAEDAVVSNTYTELNFGNMHYTFNQSGGYTNYQPIYLVGTVNSNGYFVLDNSSATSFYTQTLPSTEDGKIYIYLGQVYSTNSMRLTLYHPIYEYKNGRVQLYVPDTYWSGSSSGNVWSLNSSNIGIGKTNPAYKLDVSGTANFDGLAYGVTPGETQTLALSTVEYVNAKVGGSAGITTGTSGQTLRHNGTGWVANSLLYNNGTNVGIGVTNPSGKLHIDGKTYSNDVFVSRFGLSSSELYNTAQTKQIYGLFGSITSGVDDTFGNLYGIGYSYSTLGGAAFSNQHNIVFTSAGVVKATIGTNNGDLDLKGRALIAGNVGVGTTAPGRKFVVQTASGQSSYAAHFMQSGTTVGNSTLVGFAIEGNGWSKGAIGFQRTGSYDTGSLVFLNRSVSTDGTSATAENDTRMVITSVGNVGIATTAPIQKLHVNGGAQLDSVSFGVTPGTTQTLALTTVEYVNSMVSGASTSTVGYWSANGNNIYNANSGNIGIGVTNPSQKLQVVGVGYFQGTNGIYINPNIGGSGNAVISTDTGQNLRFRSGSSEVMFLGSSGNIGIGTVAPYGKFTVSGSAGITRSIVVDSREIKFRGDGVAHFSIFGPDTGQSYLTIQNTGSNSSPGTIGPDLFTVRSTGNVGIATTNPTQKFHVNGGAQLDAISFGVTPGESQALALTTVEYVNAKVGGSAGITTGTSGQTLRHNGTGWVANSVLYNDGTNVGIGVTNPGSLLTIANNQWMSAINSTDTGIVNMFKVNTNNQIEVGAPLLIGPLEFAADSGLVSFLDMPVTSGAAIGTPEGYSMKIDGNNILTVYAESNGVGGVQNSGVGIGTASPEGNLHVYGTNAKFFVEDSQVGGEWLRFSAGTVGSSLKFSNTGTFAIGPVANKDDVSVANAFVINSSSNIGIGKTNPAYKLDVAGTANFDGLAYGITPGTTQTLALTTVEYVNSMVSGASTSTVGYWSANGNNIYNANSGNVGIGITNPSWALDINKAGNAASIHIQKTDATTASWYLHSGRLNAGEFTIADNGAYRLTIANGGNVGIGTTNPVYMLDVASHIRSTGNVYANDKIITSRYGMAGTYNSAQVQGIWSIGDAYQIDTGTDTFGSLYGMGYAYNQNGGSPFASDHQIVFTNNGAITSAIGLTTGRAYFSGNVGIGTTNPTQKLHVNGIAQLDSVSFGVTPGSGQTLALATVEYVNATVATGSYLPITGGTMQGPINMGGFDITNVNKLTAGTVDPLYRIQGVNYSTFAPSVVGGVKEEYVGKIEIADRNSQGEYEAVIDFDKSKEGSDLWVWRKVVDFSQDNINVLITPYGSFANTYYKIEGNKIIIRSSRPVSASYRLIGQRHDWKEWPTKAKDQNEKPSFIID